MSFFKIVIETTKGGNDQSFVVIDQFEFLQSGIDCKILPDAAKPQVTTTPKPTEAPTTTTQGPTTPVPTEPPGRKNSYSFLV